MNAKIKAKQLMDDCTFISISTKKELTLKTVELLIKELNSIPKYATCDKFEYKKKFWNDVKKELELF